MGNTSTEILINALTAKRAELASALERNQAEQAKIIADLGTVDSALLMFAPHIKVDAIAPKQLPPVFAAERGEISLLAFDILRNAAAPMSVKDLNLQIMIARNLNTNNAKLVSMMRERLQATLRNKRRQKQVRSIKSANGEYLLWEIVR